MKKDLVCIVCPVGCRLTVDIDNDYAVTGNQCKRGMIYGKKELTNPTRTITSTVVIFGASTSRLPVKTNKEVSKKMIFPILKELDHIRLQSPIKVGDIVIENVLNTGVDVVASRSM